MPERPVPVSMGSSRALTRDCGACLATLAWFPPGAVLEPHVHERPVFSVILEGGFDLVFTSPAIRRSSLACPPGTLFTEPAGEKHANYVTSRGARVVALQPDVVNRTLPRRLREMLDRINHFRDGPLGAFGRQLARELAAGDDLTPLAVEGLALEMLAEGARIQPEQRLRGNRCPPWLRQATDFVHDRFREGLRIDDVAAVAGVHPAHLAAVFRRVHRQPIGSYVRRLRVDWAAERLVDGDDPISAIACEAGFADQAHFTRAFKRATGTTPASYRKARRPSG